MNLNQYRKFKNDFFKYLFIGLTFVAIFILALLLFDVFSKGIPYFKWHFLTNYPSRFPEKAGLLSAWVGSLWMLAITIPIAVFLGLTTAIYMEEYADKNNRLTQLIQANINNLAGVPSIVFGILGLALFVRGLGLGRSILSGSLTMALLVLPVIIVAAQEAIKAIPGTIRQGSFALGATKWQTILRVVLPAALPGIMTGSILAVSRALGETAPLIMIGAMSFVAFLPVSPMDSFTVLPIQIFNWTSRPQEEFQFLAAAGIIVLLTILMAVNALAVYIRRKYTIRW